MRAGQILTMLHAVADLKSPMVSGFRAFDLESFISLQCPLRLRVKQVQARSPADFAAIMYTEMARDRKCSARDHHMLGRRARATGHLEICR